MKVNNKRIPSDTYKEFHRLMPILCVDLVVKHHDRFLLVKRKNKPAQGKWWFPGGRVWKGETLKASAKRKLKEEVGLKTNEPILLGFEETFFRDGPFGDPTHSINAVFMITVTSKTVPVLDNQSSNAMWYDNVDRKWDGYVKKFLALSQDLS